MITNDIQELLDGSLSDGESAELLHALSVSPERRAEFRQFMSLKGELGRDRQGSALTPEEDAKAWRGIAAMVGGASPALHPMSGAFSWIGRAAVVTLVGVGGYLLGSGRSGSLPRADRNPVLESNLSVRSGADRFSTLLAGLLPDDMSKAGALSTERRPVERVVYRDRWRESVRIVYRDRPAPTHTLARNNPVDQGSGMTSRPDPFDRNGGADRRAESLAPLSAIPSLAASAADTIEEAMLQRAPSTIPDAPMISDTSENEAAFGRTRQPGLDGRNLPLAPVLISGLEVGYSERVGRLVSVPRGRAASTSYGGRYVDVGYRFGESGLGMGFRLGRGTFSAVTLVGDQTIRRDGAVSRIDTIYRPHIDETREWTVEFFGNYRFSLADRFAVGAEASYNNSTTHQKLGLDLLALWFLTDRVGLQIGGGLSHYWYDLGAERLRLLQSGENIGVSDDALDSYKGSVLEGRYGLMYRF